MPPFPAPRFGDHAGYGEGVEIERAGQAGDLEAIIALEPDLQSKFEQLKEAMRDFTALPGEIS